MTKVKNFNIHIEEDYHTICRAAALHIVSFVKNKPDAVLGFATGNSPKLLYKYMIEHAKAHEVSFSKVKTFNLDEYVGLEKDSLDNYRNYMDLHLFKQLDFNLDLIHFPNTHIDLKDAIKNYQASLDKHTIDIQILGIGQNGHIGFNEPGTSFDEQTHQTTLHESTLKANLSEFKHTKVLPKTAITMGISDIMKAKEILLVANGKHKAIPIYHMIYDEVSIQFPASILQNHTNVHLYLDRDAAEKIAAQ